MKKRNILRELPADNGHFLDLAPKKEPRIGSLLATKMASLYVDKINICSGLSFVQSLSKKYTSQMSLRGKKSVTYAFDCAIGVLYAHGSQETRSLKYCKFCYDVEAQPLLQRTSTIK